MDPLDLNASGAASSSNAAPLTAAHASDSSTLAAAPSGSFKDKRHFKKSMIVEYEKIESTVAHHHLPAHNDDSQSSSSCASFGGSPLLARVPPKLSLASRLDELGPSKFEPLPPAQIDFSSTALPDVPTLASFAQQLHDLKQTKTNQPVPNISSPQVEPLKTEPIHAPVNDTDGNESSNLDAVVNQKKRKKLPNEGGKSSKPQSKKAKSDDSANRSGGKERKKSGSGGSSKKKTDKSSSKKTPTKKKGKEEEKVLYCICREEANKRFMIACDNCDEWYHGVCVGVSESLSSKIKSFFCHLCRNKKPSLTIKYKSRFRDVAKLVERNGKFDEANADSATAKFWRESKARLKKEAELLKSRVDEPNKASKKSHQLQPPPPPPPLPLKPKEEPTTSAVTDVNLSQLETSSSTKFFGKANIPGEDIADFFSAITILNQNRPPPPLAGPASNVSQIDHDYLAGSTSSHSRPLQTSHGEAFPVRAHSSGEEHHNHHHDEDSSLDSFSSMSSSSSDKTSTSSSNSKTSSGSLTRSDATSDSGDVSMSDEDDQDGQSSEQSSEDEDSSDESGSEDGAPRSSGKKSLSGKKTGAKRKTDGKSRLTGSNKKRPASKTSSKVGLKGKKTKPVKRLVTTKHPTAKSNKLRKTVSGGVKDSASAASVTSNSNQTGIEEGPREPTQCLGPECVNESKLNSKYCSIECGMRLARNRLVYFLKERLNDQMLEPCDADRRNEEALERIQTEMQDLRKKLGELEEKHTELDRVIERAKFASINPNIERDRAKSLDCNETEIFCVTCGLLVSEKLALKHMEKCYNKVESLAFFGSFQKSQIESGQPLFCDYFNPQTKMYCKRLKTMCPEHEKEKKIGENEVCGCPLPNSTNILNDAENELCLAPKRSCSVHFKWEKLRRAQIDLEKLRTWLKLEELLEQKRQNETALTQRRGLLSLMLYKTELNIDPSTSQHAC